MKIVKRALEVCVSMGVILTGVIFIISMLVRDEDTNPLVKIQGQELKKIAAQNSLYFHSNATPMIFEPEKSKISIRIINPADKQLILSTGSSVVLVAQAITTIVEKNWEVLG